jgi:hypothetical protein
MFGENSARRGEPTLCARQVLKWRLIITNGGGNFVQYHGNPKNKTK